MVELRAVRKALQEVGYTPAVFVVNVYGAEEFLPRLDETLGEIPVVWLRRELMWLQECRTHGTRNGWYRG